MELKPCPFCGHRDAQIERYGTYRASTIYECGNCGCRLETGEEFNHGRLWNERHRSKYLVVGHGESDLPEVFNCDTGEEIEHAIIQLQFFDGDASGHEEMIAEQMDYFDDLGNWEAGVLEIRFEIGGITIYQVTADKKKGS